MSALSPISGAKVMVKPLSVNAAYTGRRFATPGLKAFKKEMHYSLMPVVIPEGPLTIRFTFGVSNRGQDVDDCIKCALDCISKKFKFNDNRIYLVIAEKKITKKKEEYISFSISPYGVQA